MTERLKYLFDNFDKFTVEENKFLSSIIEQLINKQTSLDELEKIIKSALKETLKVYETLKSMYNNFDEEIERNVNKLRNRFNYLDVESLLTSGRKYARNI